MNDKEKIETFGELVEATVKLTNPWKKLCFVLAGVVVAVSVIMGGIIFYLVHCAYMTPEEFEQTQQFTEQTQSQSHSSGVTGG